MHKISVVLACLVYTGQARRVQTSAVSALQGQQPQSIDDATSQSTEALASLLLAVKPAATRGTLHPGLARSAQQRAPHFSRAGGLQMFYADLLREEAKKAKAKAEGKEEIINPEDVVKTEVPFEIRFSLGDLVSLSGSALLIYSIGSFFLNNGDSGLVQTLGFVYAIPATLGGLALKYAELPPVPLDTSPAAEKLREVKANPTLMEIVSDSTRYDYGDAHLEEPLRSLNLAPPGGEVPELVNLAEEVTEDGQYALTLRFKAPVTPWRVWKDRAPRFANFFGPDIRATIKKYSIEDRLVEVSLISREPEESDEAMEYADDGELVPIMTTEEAAARKVAKEAAAADIGAPEAEDVAEKKAD